jgi:hypothetical protein
VNSTTIDLAPIVNALIGVAAAMIAPLFMFGMTWLRLHKHWRILEDARVAEAIAAANETINASAQRFGAAFLAKTQKAGGSIFEVNVGSPELAYFANRLISNYPDFVGRLGYTSDKAAAIILDEAQKIAHISPTVPAPAPVIGKEW